MTSKKRFSACITLLLVVVLGLAGCSHQPTVYAPAAYGQNNQCYYVNDPAEAIALQNAGLCPRSWAPTLMPLFWHQQYYPYYSSGAYYNTYVPVSVRHVYVVHETSFQRSYASQIKTASATAKYKGSDGKTYTGNKVKPGSFSNGTKGFGGGRKCALGPISGISILTKGGGGSGGSGGSRGGSFGGGSKGSGGGSKGGGGSKTGSGSKPKSGC